MIQAGNYGLIKAIHGYDVNNRSKATFVTYAFNWIKTYTELFVHSAKSMIRPPYREKNNNKWKQVDMEKTSYRLREPVSNQLNSMRSEFMDLVKSSLSEVDYYILATHYKLNADG